MALPIRYGVHTEHHVGVLQRLLTALCQYLVLSVGDAREATASLPKTLNPQWDESFEFPINGPEALVVRGVCWDKDRFKKDYMGELEILLEEVFTSAETLAPEVRSSLAQELPADHID
jgi:hypothetical protein